MTASTGGTEHALSWSEWVPLLGVGHDQRIPGTPGLYRVRRTTFEGVDYIGQTGVSLRGRLGMLAGIYRAEMPYRDPHTAGPGLWALRHAHGSDFEASTSTFEGPAAQRKGLEALAISLYRRSHGGSPTVNFGRIPAGYRASSGNNARLVAAGRRFRGGPDTEAAAPAATVAVHGDLAGAPTSQGWMGWHWTSWAPAPQAEGRGGLYRLRRCGDDSLVYVGQGRIADRVTAHLAKAAVAGHRQAEHFTGRLEVSWVEMAEPVVTLLEHENDLIASHVLALGRPPAAQFLG